MPEHPALTSNLLGRLDWNAIPFNEPILLYTFIAVACGGVAILAAITYFRGWVPLWRDWSPASTTRRSASCTSFSEW
jgi:cytochrome o ubiquinol oxidase subunit 1